MPIWSERTKTKLICIIVVGMVLVLGSDAHGALARQSAAGTAGRVSGEHALLSQYCITCHNERAKTAGLALDTMDIEQVEKDAEVWERVVRKIRTGMMPPSGARRPQRAVLDAFASELEKRLDSAAALNPNPGTPALTRLNRTEYGNAIRNLGLADVPRLAAREKRSRRATHE